MKAISLWQPWASLWAEGSKIHETRHWETRHRGWLLVHAAKHKPPAREDVDPTFEDIVQEKFGADWRHAIPYGALIGAVNVDACVSTNGFTTDWHVDFLCGNFGADRFAWRAAESVRFPRPLPYTGRQGLFTVPEAVVATLRSYIPGEVL